MNSAYGGTYCAPMWAKFFAAALKDQDHPSFKDFPWTFTPVGGQDAGHVAVGVAVGERQRDAEPDRDQDDHAEAAADQDRGSDAAADADEDAPADADAHRHLQRRAVAGGRVDLAAPTGAIHHRLLTAAGALIASVADLLCL